MKEYNEYENTEKENLKIIDLGIIKQQPYEIRKNNNGYGIYSLKNYNEDEICYKGTFSILPNDGTSFKYMTENGISIVENSYIHYVLTKNNKRIRYSDCIINHSCDGNIYMWKKTNIVEDDENCINEFIMKTRKKINIGDEFTCDYNLFDWDCAGTSFICNCQSIDCIGEVKGFKYLQKDKQIKCLPYLDEIVLNSYNDFYSKDKVKNLGKIIFNEYKILKNDLGYGIYSKLNYKVGEVCYIGKFEALEDNGFHYIFETEDGLTVEEDPLVNYVLLYGKRFRYSDCFINHSCDPNIYCGPVQTPTNPESTTGEYEMIVRKEIKIGDQLTCDYEMFDWDCSGHSFKCSCGSKNCRGEIKGFKYLKRELQEKYLQYADNHIKELYYQLLDK